MYNIGVSYTKELADLIEEFRKFPAIGPKSAQRMAFSLLKRPDEQIEKFLGIIENAKNNIRYCNSCFNLSNSEQCDICLDSTRDTHQICIVESVKDLIAIEKTHEYKGLYFVLGGVISPLDGITAEDLNINELKHIITSKITQFQNLELIFAISLSTEGEATMLYLKRYLNNFLENNSLDSSLLRITRLAHGLPAGADLDYADEVTIAKALTGRVLA